MKNKGFTLIELLVVIALIGVLAAGVIVTINPLAKINSANLAKVKTFSKSVENSISAAQVGKWSFEESASPSKDTSGYGNNGTWGGGITSQPVANCVFGKCLNFDGVNDDYVETASFAGVAKAYTVTAWIRWNGVGSVPPWGNIVVKKYAGGDNFGLWVHQDGYIHHCATTTDPIRKCFNTANIISANNWYHIAGVFDGSNFYTYVNGVIEKTFSIWGSGELASSLGSLWIGKHSSGSCTWACFKGLIDEVAIYDKALNLSQIQQLYARGLIKHLLALR